MALASLALVLAAAPRVNANLPPPSHFEPASGATPKSAPVVVYDNGNRDWNAVPYGQLLETKNYCNAVVDVSASAGVLAHLVVTASATGAIDNNWVPEHPPYQLGSLRGRSTNETFVVPLRHRFTDFEVRVDDQSPKGHLRVVVTGLSCRISGWDGWPGIPGQQR